MIKCQFLLFITIVLFACKQANTAKTPIATDVETVNTLRKYRYADAAGKSIFVQNSLPKGNPYTAPNGKQYFSVIFWTSITNETDNALETAIHFPADFYEVAELPGNYYKVFIANDTITTNKEPLTNYGFTGLQAFLNNNINKPTALKRTIRPKATSGFYVVLISHSTNVTKSGALRTGFKIKGQRIVYDILRYVGKPSFSLISKKEIDCGSINLKNLVLKQ